MYINTKRKNRIKLISNINSNTHMVEKVEAEKPEEVRVVKKALEVRLISIGGIHSEKRG